MDLNKIKILIGDDSILARKQLKDLLFSYGATDVLEAVNGQETIDLYKEEHPQLVFLDIVMPIKDGITVVHEIKEFDPDADIIMVSSVGTKSQLRSAIEEGAKDFVQKPLNKNQIEDILKIRYEGR